MCVHGKKSYIIDFNSGKMGTKTKVLCNSIKRNLVYIFLYTSVCVSPFISCFIVCINKNTGTTVTENQENSKNNLNY